MCTFKFFVTPLESISRVNNGMQSYAEKNWYIFPLINLECKTGWRKYD